MENKELIRKFRKALELSVDEIVGVLEDLGLEPGSLEADIQVRLVGTNTEIRIRPKLTFGCSEPARASSKVT